MRLVIKIGTQVISDKTGLLSARIKQIVSEIAKLLKAGHEVILVTSGAIGTGLPLVVFKDQHRKKVAAAVGQPLLMNSYIREAEKYKIRVGQILIISDDFTNRERFKNFVSNMEAMLVHKILPIINENDVMKREDLTIGDNDTLGAMVAVGLQADKFLILTNQNGLYTCNPDHDKNAKLVNKVTKINQKIENLCAPDKSELGLGGMQSKIQAAKYTIKHGVGTLIGNGQEKNIILQSLGKNFPGTIFIARKAKKGR